MTLNPSTLRIRRTPRAAHRLDTKAAHRACEEAKVRMTEELRAEREAMSK